MTTTDPRRPVGNPMPGARAIAVADPRRPFVVDVRSLGRRPGAMQEGPLSVDAPESLGLDLVTVAKGTPIALELRLESVLDGVLVTADVAARISGECARCLEPLTAVLDTGFTELWSYPEHDDRYARHAEPGQEQDEEVHRLTGDLLDLEQAVRDALVLALPIRPLCQPDCRGLCVDCGARWDDLPVDHRHERTDPRWAALLDHTGDPSAHPQSRSQED